jgi:hypothetical protein
MGPPTAEGGMADMRALLGAAGGQVGSGEQPIPAQEVAPGNTAEGAAVGAGPGPAPGPGGPITAQTMVKGGEASNRLLMQSEIEGGQPPPEE